MAEFDCGFARIAGRSGRVEPRRQARAYLLALLSDVDTRTCWQLAEQAGNASPHRMQRLLGEGGRFAAATIRDGSMQQRPLKAQHSSAAPLTATSPR